MKQLVAFECVAGDHQPGLLHPDKLTIHQGRWAFCAFDARADGHEWRETGGADIGSLMHHSGLGVLSATEAAAKGELKTAKA